MIDPAPCDCPSMKQGKEMGQCTCCPPERKFEKPVSWLLGRQLIASLKSTLLYTAFGSKIDARDWMDAKVFPSDRGFGETGHVDEASREQRDEVSREERDNTWLNMYDREFETKIAGAELSPEPDFTGDDGEFWFDYISDTGDGMTATYSIAYLCLTDLFIEKIPDHKKPAHDVYARFQTREEVKGLERLPRGEFLLVGGDTSYHMADYASLGMRFQQPFRWAYDDLRKHRGLKRDAELTDEERKAEGEKEIKRLRPIFGIPGNHDYYDMLDGFRRQFREPTRSRSEEKFFPDDFGAAQLKIPGFRRHQETSYVALRLPFDWMIWGLDTEVGTLDDRQQDFFLKVKERCGTKKLIVCTSAPTTVFGKFADKDDKKSAKAFSQLGLARPFLRSENEDAPHDESAKKEPPPEDTKLQADEIRLDLAGDVHQYARYWGPDSPTTHPRPFSAKRPLHRVNYASVMSGLGGAFHHPSTTYLDEIREQALYPDEQSSREHVAIEIFNPWRVVKGGGVWFVGGMVALILSFAAIADRSSRPAIHNFGLFNQFGITEPERYTPTVASEDEAKRNQGDIRLSVWGSLKNQLGYATAPWTPQLSNAPGCKDAAETSKPLYLWGKCKVEWPVEYKWGFVMLLLTLPAMVGAIAIPRYLYQNAKKKQEADDNARKNAKEGQQVKPLFCNRRHIFQVRVAVWGLTLLIAVLAIASVLLIMPYRNFITPFGNSLLVLLSVCWSVVAMVLSVQHSDWLFAQASKRSIRRRDWAITWVLAACAFFGLAAGLWIFGKNNPAAYLVADIVSVVVVLAIPILLLILGWRVGGAHQRWLGKVGMALIGIFHGILQIAAAVFLIKKGTWLTVILSVVLVLFFWAFGRALMRRNLRGLLTAAWILFGVVMLALPPVVYDFLIQSRDAMSPELYAGFLWPHSVDPVLPFSQYEWWIEWKGWWQLIPIFIGGVFGAFLSCVWLGWYFGVCLGFHGHNNETGGAARIEKFKQLVRFRLKKDSLTGYVIAIRDPQRCGKCLHPQIVDIFHLTKETKASS